MADHEEPDGKLTTSEELAERMAQVRQELKQLEVEFAEVLPDEEVESQTARLVDGTVAPRPKLDEFEQKMADIEARMAASRETRTEKKRTETRIRESDGKATRGLGMGLSIAYTILGGPVVGAAIGIFLDRGSEVKIATSIGALIGSILGLAGAFFLLQRANRE